MAEIVTETERSIRRAARRGLVVFLPLVVVLSGAVETWLILHPQQAGIGIAVLMFCPTIAAVVTRLVRREGFADVSFRLGGRRALPWYALAVLLPLAVGSLAYGVAAATGLIGMTGGGGAVLALLGALLFGPVWVAIVFAAGEEIGWRGYLLPRMIDAGAPYPLLLVGLIWSAWHLPLIFAGLYVASTAPLALTVVLFVIAATAISIIFSRMRLATGSVWTAVVAHGIWNAVIQGAFDRAAAGEQVTLWVGEAGVLTVVVLVVLAVLVTHGPGGRTRVELGRRPGEPDRPVVSANDGPGTA